MIVPKKRGRLILHSFVIIPVNYSLAAVNFFVGSTGVSDYPWKPRKRV